MLVNMYKICMYILLFNLNYYSLAVRLVLTAVVTASWHNFRRVITKQFGTDVRLWFTIITLTQFHFIFYMSRPLPNVIALPVGKVPVVRCYVFALFLFFSFLVLYALAFWLQGQTKPFIICSGIAILIFRSELLIFLGLLLAYDVIFRKVTISR